MHSIRRLIKTAIKVIKNKALYMSGADMVPDIFVCVANDGLVWYNVKNY